MVIGILVALLIWSIFFEIGLFSVTFSPFAHKPFFSGSRAPLVGVAVLGQVSKIHPRNLTNIVNIMLLDV